MVSWCHEWQTKFIIYFNIFIQDNIFSKAVFQLGPMQRVILCNFMHIIEDKYIFKIKLQ